MIQIMTPPKVIAITLLATIILTNNSLSWFIVSYIEKKPSLHQTLLDKLTLRLIISSVTSLYAGAIVSYLSVFPLTLQPWIGKSLFLANSFFYCLLLSWFITVICVKYICIFHPLLFVECGYTDSEIAKYVSIVLIAVIGTGLGLEMGLDDEIEKFAMYQLLMSETMVDEHTKKKGLTKVVMILYALSFITVSFTNIQITRNGFNKHGG